MSNRVVWITGAHGFIGRNLAKTCAESGDVVAGIGHGAWPSTEAGQWGVSHWLNAEIAASNLQTLHIASGTPDVVVHLAGGSSVGSAIAQPREDCIRTVISTVELFEWLRQYAPETSVVCASSAAVYGTQNPGLIEEGATLRPYSPYGYHKRMMESICESYGSSFKLRSVVARLFSVYGNGLKKQLLWDLCTKLAREPKRLELDGTGNELRDWVAVSDAARILSELAPLASSEAPKFNIGTGIGTTVRQIAHQLLTAWCGDATEKTEIAFSGRSRAGDPFSLVASPLAIAKIGFSCNVQVSEGIARYVDWFRQYHE